LTAGALIDNGAGSIDSLSSIRTPKRTGLMTEWAPYMVVRRATNRT